MLEDAGVDLSAVVAADVRHAVGTFRRFAALPVVDAELPEEDGDGVLAQFGPVTFVISESSRSASHGSLSQLVARTLRCGTELHALLASQCSN